MDKSIDKSFLHIQIYMTLVSPENVVHYASPQVHHTTVTSNKRSDVKSS